MAGKIVRQTRFTGGEVDVINYKRTDSKLYLTALQSALNTEIGTIGQIRKRKGTQFLLDVSEYAEGNSQLYELTDKNNNHYLGLSADLKFYIFADNQNLLEYVVDSNGDQIVTGYGTNVVTQSTGIEFVQQLDTPYTSEQLADIDASLDNDVLVLVHPERPPARIYISSYSPLTFAYQVMDIYPQPSYDFNLINYNDFTVTIGVAGNTLTFTLTTPTVLDPGFTSAWVDGQIVGGGASETAPLGYAIITNVGAYNTGTKQVVFTADIQVPFQTSGYATKASQYSIKQAAWSSDIGYPSKVVFYQNRLWMANTKALESTIFGSKINAPINFDVGVGRDTDAIVYNLTGDTGPIVALNAGKQLEIFTTNKEVACPQDQNIALTPNTFAARPQSGYGSSTFCKPISYLNDTYFVSATGNSIYNFHFDGVGLAYTTTPVCPQSNHLVKQPINRAILRGSEESQDNFIYYLNNDSTVTAFQFSVQEGFAALTPIEFQENIRALDIATINNQVFFLKYYDTTGVYAVEAFVDDVKMDGYIVETMASDGLINGLEVYNGYEVQVTYENQDFGVQTVEDGEITVENPEGDFGTVQVGLNYDVEIIPMYLYAGPQGNDYFKKINMITVDYYNSLDFTVNGKLVPYQSFRAIQEGEPLTPQTGTAIVYPVKGWNRYDTFTIAQESPFDLEITAISYQLEATIA